jgi:hypothetical protein
VRLSVSSEISYDEPARKVKDASISCFGEIVRCNTPEMDITTIGAFLFCIAERVAILDCSVWRETTSAS